MSERVKDYYAARAKGGSGLIILKTVMLDWETGRNTDAVISIDDDKFIPGQTELVKVIRDHGAKVAIQLLHAGADAIDVSGWGNDAPGKKPSDIMHLARAIKQAVNVPVMAVGGRMTPEVAEIHRIGEFVEAKDTRQMIHEAARIGRI